MPPSQEPLDGWAYRSKYDPKQVPRFSLVFPIDWVNRKVLLGLKRRGFGAGLYNGFGGKPEAEEDMVACARRELLEECGIAAQLDHLSQPSLIDIGMPDRSGGFEPVRLYLYTVSTWSGQPVETDEMIPKWYALPNESQHSLPSIPFEQMWPEATVYLPLILDPAFASATFRSYFEYQIVSPTGFEPWQFKGKSDSEDRSEALVGWDLRWT